jgi:preprotein translocase subunit SecE
VADEEDKAAAESGDQPTQDVGGDVETPAITEAERIAAAAAARPTRKSTTAVVEGKGRATRKQREATTQERRKRTTPVEFVRESIEELRKVIWPTLSQLQQYFIVVLVFVLVVIAFVGALDLLFGWALLKIFG